MGGFNIAQRKVMAEKKKNEKSKTKTWPWSKYTSSFRTLDLEIL
jgi:hypothetical protein